MTQVSRADLALMILQITSNFSFRVEPARARKSAGNCYTEKRALVKMSYKYHNQTGAKNYRHFELPELRAISPLGSDPAKKIETVTSKQLRGNDSLSVRAAYGTADLTLLLQRIDSTQRCQSSQSSSLGSQNMRKATYMFAIMK